MGEAVAVDVELAGDAVGHPAEVLGEHVGAGVGEGAADGDGGGVRRDLPVGGPDGGLGGAVDVDQALDLVLEVRSELDGHGFAAGEGGDGVVVEARGQQ